MRRLSAVIAGLATVLVVSSPVSAETISYTDATRALVAACGADINANCTGIKPGGNRIQACLAANASKVSAQCKDTYAAVFASISARAAAQAAAPELCQGDARRYCSNFRVGGGHMLMCLTRSDNFRKISRKCRDAIVNAGWQ